VNLSVQPPICDRTDRKTDETLVGEDTEAFDRPDRMRSKNQTEEIPAPKALLPLLGILNPPHPRSSE
jgi:hypothetical protein